MNAALSQNFAFLEAHDPPLVRLGADAERFFSRDPDVSLLRLRQFGERLAQRTAALSGLYSSTPEGQAELLRRLQDRGLITPDVARLFHSLRREGNRAAHDAVGDHRQALLHLRLARELGVWFHRTFGPDRSFRPGPFMPPPDPAVKAAADGRQLQALEEELATLRQELADRRTEAETARAAAEEAERQRLSAEERARREAEDHAAALALAEESEAQRLALAAELSALQARAEAAPPEQRALLFERAQEAGREIELDEAATRQLIDEQLRQAGWEADSRLLRFSQGTRPQKGRNLAIAEWPTRNGPADYALFAGLVPLGVVEAKRQKRNVSGSIEQAKRYSQGFQGLPPDVPSTPSGGPWGEYQVPFLFATNGRPYLRQLEHRSGIWFLDARRRQNHSRVLTGWYSPEGLAELLKQDQDRAEAALRAEPPEALGFLYDFQAEAIGKVEEALERGERSCLVAMATGTGKTRMSIGLIYRLLKTRRFRRVLFLVDRQSLGEQAQNAFKDTRVEGLLNFDNVFDLKGLGAAPDPDTRVQVATIQSMARRLFATDAEARPRVDEYDCLVVDECHRGYLLDRELSDQELQFRDEAEYISVFRRVLDHFDAVKIGLTATPALHTVDIFGQPVFRYTYRQAVLEGRLVDHEPPVRIVTKLAADGMTWEAGEEMLILDVEKNSIDPITLPDEVNLGIDDFNRVVVTESFNRAVCGVLARHIDPSLREKTIVFCVDDDHADLVTKELKDAFVRVLGELDEDAVQKITGKADRPLEKIRRFRNEHLPTVAVTVDLLTTGIDVPEVANLVFLRRVKSRILYEQMLGRATRLCPDLHKESFRIFDAVDLYSALAPVSEMRPVAVNPRISFGQLMDELAAARAQELPEDVLREILDQFLARLQRKRNELENSGRLQERFGISPGELAERLLRGTPEDVDWLLANRGIADLLDRLTGPSQKKIISLHPDSVIEVSHGYGDGFDRPEDYLEGFKSFVQNSLNQIPALLTVVQRPRDLTRAQLREVKQILDAAHYSETALRVAWREMTNQDIAASIVGHIRQAALGDPLLPYSERVDRGLRQILSSHPWTQPQRKWLERIGNRLKEEGIVDRETFEQGAFKTEGGFKRLDRVFEGRLADLLGDLQEAVWQQAG